MSFSYEYETGPIRPPSEASSLLVRVSRNCTYNRCRFCTSYHGQRFEKRAVQEVKDDIDRMAAIAELLLQQAQLDGGRMTQQVLEAVARKGVGTHLSYQIALFLVGGGQNVFLQDANSLALPAEDLVAVLEHLYLRFPNVKRVTSYARSRTLAQRGAQALTEIRKAGLTRVHVGLESGSDEVLAFIRKGVTAEGHIAGGQAAKQAGLELSEYVMPGVGGGELSERHAIETARVLTAIDPHFIRLRSFYPLPGSELADELKQGSFVLLDEEGLVHEIRRMTEALGDIHSTLASDHDRNLLMEVEGTFPRDRDYMLGVIDRYLQMPEEERLLFRIGRRLGHFRLLDDLQDQRAHQAAEEAVDELTRRFGDAEAGLYRIIQVQM